MPLFGGVVVGDVVLFGVVWVVWLVVIEKMYFLLHDLYDGVVLFGDLSIINVIVVF